MPTYSDSTITVLKGYNPVYYNSGLLTVEGNYLNNKRDGSWNYYNDTSTVIKKKVYDAVMLLKTSDPDTVKKDRADYTDNKKATFKGRQKAWQKYSTSNLDANVGINPMAGRK